MEKELCHVRKGNTQEGEELLLQYFLLGNEKTKKNSKTAVFGVQVSEFLDGVLCETQYVEGVADCRDKILKILQKLADGLVTPVSLVNILDDIIE